MTTLKDWLIIVLAIIVMVMVLLKGCSNPFPNLEIQPEPKVVTKSDTVWTKDTLIKFKSIIKPKWDTIYKIDTIKEGVSLDDLFYVRKYNDSLADGTLTIYSNIKVVGILSKIDLSYKLKAKPSLITNNITTTITNVKIQPNKVSIITGVELGGNRSSFSLSPFIRIDINKASIGYRYGLLDGTHSVGVGYKIFNSKK